MNNVMISIRKGTINIWDIFIFRQLHENIKNMKNPKIWKSWKFTFIDLENDFGWATRDAVSRTSRKMSQLSQLRAIIITFETVI